MKEIHIILKTREKWTITFERNDKKMMISMLWQMYDDPSVKMEKVYITLKHQRIPEGKLYIYNNFTLDYHYKNRKYPCTLL